MTTLKELKSRILDRNITNIARAALLRQYACMVSTGLLVAALGDAVIAHSLLTAYERAARELEDDMRGFPPEYGVHYLERISESDTLFLSFE